MTMRDVYSVVVVYRRLHHSFDSLTNLTLEYGTLNTGYDGLYSVCDALGYAFE